jgi:Caspase domain
MRRREFILGAISSAALAVRPARGQTTPLARAAVLIGVNKAGNLPVLRAASSGAHAMATWLNGEGFEVKLFVDDTNPVRVSDVFDAIDELVSRGTLDPLVVYFSGHGFLSGYAEHWMLSKAPDNPNEAISLVESVVLAKQSGISNVVFISDACRSTADSLGTTHVRGSLVFPNRNIGRTHTDIDKFLATLAGEPAYELPVAESTAKFDGIYTSCFLDAFVQPDANMIKTIDGGVRVVPNRNLRSYLEREVQKKAAQKSIRLSQIPDAEVISDESVYIGRVAPGTGTTAAAGTALPQATVADVAHVELKRLGASTLGGIAKPVEQSALDQAAAESGFKASQQKVLSAQARAEPSFQTGFTVYGSRVIEAVGDPEAQIDIEADGSSVRMGDAFRRPGSIAIRFQDGSCTLAAALPGYIGTVVVDAGGVINVSYVPSISNWRRSEYESQRGRLDQLRATVASAARFGIFRITGDRENRSRNAQQLGDTIRIAKSLDPTLGLYAAYAYNEADLIEQVRSVQAFMHSDLETDLFDVLLLAGLLREVLKDSSNRGTPVPLCPMLSQGWELLRVKNVQLAPELETARNFLRPALWTTFEPPAFNLLVAAIRRRSQGAG